MGKFLKIGGIGCLGIIILIVACTAIVSNQPKPQQQVSGQPAAPGDGKPQLARIGQTANLGGWEVTLNDFAPIEKFGGKKTSTKPQGRMLVADMKIKNTQNSSSNFTTSDFVLKSLDGREFKPDGESAVIEKGFMISQNVQPGLVTENRIVFDTDPAVTDWTFTALKMQFSVQAP